MRQYIPVITLSLVGALALALVSGGLIPSDNAALAVHIEAPTNAPPEFATGGGDRSIAENTPAGVNVGAPISATDADGDVLTYSLGGTDADSFDIDSSTGQLITKVELNYEDTTSYTVTVTADDGREADNSSLDQPVTIMVDDVNEEPGQPAPPVVTTGAVSGSETTTLEINWYAPENIGDTINDYDYRYKKTTDTTWTEGDDSSSSDLTTVTISSLEADTAYQVSVRAGSPEGDGPWSLAAVGSTNKDGNAAPEFPASETGARSVAENTPADQRVGGTFTATDANSLSLTYSLEGQDKDSFNIDSSTGQIRTKDPLNHEGKASYSVFVVVEDGDGGSDVIIVTITVTDVSEQPSKPAAPTVENVEDDPETNDENPSTDADDESATRLKVSWVAPETTGPAIDSYSVEYRKGTSGAFLDDNCDAEVADNCGALTGIETTIWGLDPNSSYQVRVTANSNDEQNSLPSDTSTGSTMPSNNVPVFSQPTMERTVNENTAADTNIGGPIGATDSDRGDTLTYSLVDPNTNADTDPEDLFDIDEGTGQLKTKAALDHEVAACGYDIADDPTNCEYVVTVRATDEKRAFGDIEVTIEVRDLDEPPSAPSGLVVTVDRTNSDTELDVEWTAPVDTGKPPITEYQVRYRASGSWNSLTGVGTSTTASITSLTPFTYYNVEVRAVNTEGESAYVSGRERTSQTGNNLPEFSPATVDRSVPENTAAGGLIGDVVTATDADSDDLTYSLSGEHASLFDIDRDSGQIKVKAPLNLEAECSATDADHSTTCNYTVVVKASDGKGGSHSATVTIMVTDDDSEAPSPPSAPTVRPAEPTDDEPYLDPTTMLEVTWPEPANTGPPITSYAIQYKVMGPGNFQTDDTGDIIVFEGDDNTNRSAVITGLEDDTTYVVQVMATNDEGTKGWSTEGTGKTRFANTRPQFSMSSYSLNVEENTESNQSIGRPIVATDDDGHTLTYTLEGVHKDEFSIERGSGHIRTRGALDYESRDSYSLTVKATDTHSGSATASVTINVLDEQESPTTPGRPMVSGVRESTSEVRVTWEAPANAGRPPIIDYDVQYREAGGQYSPWTHEGTDTSTIITGLSAGTRYEVQVKAWNMEDDSEWSPAGSGSPDPDPANIPPTFSGPAPTFSVPENTAAGENIGAPVTATDADQDDLTYSLEGADAATFHIVPETGQIQTSGPLNHEEKDSHSVTVKADDSRGGMDTLDVTINVTDVAGEAPDKPDIPTVAAVSSISLSVSWVAPDNPGPPINDYDVQYRTGSGGFSPWNHEGTDTSTTITGLSADTQYEVQVRAKNDEANGEWSDSGTASTNAAGANNPPVFADGQSTNRIVSPNAQAGEHVGAPVTATDADAGDTVTYRLEGTDAATFDIEPQTGQITVRAALSNAQVGDTYSVSVVATDGTAEATIAVTITVAQVQNVAPEVPDAPTVQSASATSLTVTWDAPANQGPPITDYDVRYSTAGGLIKFWSTVPIDPITNTSVTIDNLTTGTEYDVQVRATNSVGTTAWSPSGQGTPGAAVTAGCATNGAVSDPSNTGLVSDCEALLRAKSALEGNVSPRLDWSASTPIAQWEGVYLSGTPSRVTWLILRRRSLDGTLPADLGQLDALTQLNLHTNSLSGSIPAEIGNLTNLEQLFLHNNSLSGAFPDLRRLSNLRRLWLSGADNRIGQGAGVPAWLNGLTNLEEINLWGNQIGGTIPNLSRLTKLKLLKLQHNEIGGSIPTWFGGMDSLIGLYLHNNDLTGTIPSQLGQMTRLRRLWIDRNDLSGNIPPQLGNMTNLGTLNLHGNMLTGSIPTQLGNLSRLQHLAVHNNRREDANGVLVNLGLTGTIPSALGNLSELTRLAVSNNSLSGPIPSELGDLGKLQLLWLSANQLSGAIPTELGDLGDTLTQPSDRRKDREGRERRGAPRDPRQHRVDRMRAAVAPGSHRCRRPSPGRQFRSVGLQLERTTGESRAAPTVEGSAVGVFAFPTGGADGRNSVNKYVVNIVSTVTSHPHPSPLPRRERGKSLSVQFPYLR